MASIFRQKYTVAGNNGKRIRKQSKFWYIDYKTSDGTRKRVKGFKDKQATAQLAAKLEKEAELAQAEAKYKQKRWITYRQLPIFRFYPLPFTNAARIFYKIICRATCSGTFS